MPEKTVRKGGVVSRRGGGGIADSGVVVVVVMVVYGPHCTCGVGWGGVLGRPMPLAQLVHTRRRVRACAHTRTHTHEWRGTTMGFAGSSHDCPKSRRSIELAWVGLILSSPA